MGNSIKELLLTHFTFFIIFSFSPESIFQYISIFSSKQLTDIILLSDNWIIDLIKLLWPSNFFINLKGYLQFQILMSFEQEAKLPSDNLIIFVIDDSWAIKIFIKYGSFLFNISQIEIDLFEQHK